MEAPGQARQVCSSDMHCCCPRQPWDLEEILMHPPMHGTKPLGNDTSGTNSIDKILCPQRITKNNINIQMEKGSMTDEQTHGCYKCNTDQFSYCTTTKWSKGVSIEDLQTSESTQCRAQNGSKPQNLLSV